jgi:L-2-amino-thiazoline-4-carboxylic acid hydrolase
MRVEEITKYGQPLTFPREVQKKQIGIVLSAMREEFGVWGLVPLFLSVLAEQRRLKKAHPDLVAEAARIGPEVATEMLMLTALFNVAARKKGRERAYEFLKRIFQRVAVHSMPAIYQIDDLVACDGDVFENFKEFNMAMFEAMDRQGTWKTESVSDEPDRLRLRVVTCANVDLFTAIGCPELGRLGCDHDLAGYPVILDRVHAEFRRPCTLAKGDDFCDFNFYRKGTAPPTEQLNR